MMMQIKIFFGKTRCLDVTNFIFFFSNTHESFGIIVLKRIEFQSLYERPAVAAKVR